MKTLLVLFTAFVSMASYAARRAVPHRGALLAIQCEPGRDFPGGTIQDAGYRMVYINGELVKNYSVAFVPTPVAGVILAKLWSPGHDPSDALNYSAEVKCVDPRPRAVEKPYYYPDTY